MAANYKQRIVAFLREVNHSKMNKMKMSKTPIREADEYKKRVKEKKRTATETRFKFGGGATSDIESADVSLPFL